VYSISHLLEMQHGTQDHFKTEAHQAPTPLRQASQLEVCRAAP
jgi:hypothetical protein